MPHRYRSLALGFAAVALVCAPESRAQMMPGSRPPADPNTSTPQATQPSFPQGDTRMPIFLSGTVMYEGGAGPADNVPVQRVCGGSPRTVAFTNGKGQFSFQWGSSNSLFPDAGDPGPSNTKRNGGDQSGDSYSGGTRGMSVLTGCELVASAPGYRAARVDLSGHRGSDQSDIGLMVLHRMGDVEGTSVSFTSLAAPKDARKAWEKGVRLLRSSNPADAVSAENELAKAVAIYPKYANAWADLGRARLRRKETKEARDAFLKAIDADGKLVEPYIELGTLAAHQQQWTEAARYLDRALALDPIDYPRLWLADGLADYRVRNLERAEKNAREALKLAPANQDPEASRLLGYVLLEKQDYAGANDAFRAYIHLAPNANDAPDIQARLRVIDTHLTPAVP